MHAMVAQKIDAAIEAAGTLMMGGPPEAVIARYREPVATNTTRLDAPAHSQQDFLEIALPTVAEGGRRLDVSRVG